MRSKIHEKFRHLRKMDLSSLIRPKHIQDEELAQLVFISNTLSIIFSTLTLCILLIIFTFFGWTPESYLLIIATVLYLFTIVLNQSGYSGIGRLLFCLIPIYITMVTTLLVKLNDPNQPYTVFFDSRFVLLATTILPAIVFDIREKVKIGLCVFSTSACLLLFDPIHNALGVGYFDLGFDLNFYYYINYIVLVSYLGLLISVFILKYKQTQSASKLRKRNDQLHQQEEKLMAINIELEGATQTVLMQQKELHDYNSTLEDRVKEKSNELVKANEELIKTNSELRQFSFTVSHNVRGPVASLLGLTNVISLAKSSDEVMKMAVYIQQTASKLDATLKDLSHIIDIRNDLYKVREKIHLHDEWKNAQSLIVDIGDAEININFKEAPFIFGIRPMVQSILYNLISNSIKYRDPSKPLVIEAKSYKGSVSQTIVEIRDTGLGIDMRTYRDDLFKLYKRFHHHVGGRGLGLYLVKSQMEIMNGSIDLNSEPGKGTLFTLTFNEPTDPNKQIFFENDSAQLYYDATLNNTVILWKKNVTSSEYRKVFEAVLLTIKTYKTPGWIADLRYQGKIEPIDQKWFIDNVLSIANQNGLRKIAAVGFDDPVRLEYYNRMIATTKNLNIELRAFTSMEKAIDWMASEKVSG